MLKKSLFLLPWLLLFWIIYPFGVNLINLQSVDEALIKKELLSTLENGFQREVQLEPPNDNHNIFVFGGSSVVLTDKGDDVFSKKLDRKLKDFHVKNYGHVGVDSFYIEKAIRNATQRFKPKLIILYTGHNDLTNAYRRAVRPHFSIFKNTILLTILKFMPQFKDHSEWHLDFNFDSQVHKGLSKMGLLKLENQMFQSFDNLIQEYFHRNLTKITEYCRSQNIKLVLISPIGNLHLEPTVGENLRAQYFEAKKLSYEEKLLQLKEIRDRDWLSQDVRARSGMIDTIKGFHEPRNGIYFFDLEKSLGQQKVEFGYDEFFDTFHLTDKGHELVSKALETFLRESSLLYR